MTLGTNVSLTLHFFLFPLEFLICKLCILQYQIIKLGAPAVIQILHRLYNLHTLCMYKLNCVLLCIIYSASVSHSKRQQRALLKPYGVAWVFGVLGRDINTKQVFSVADLGFPAISLVLSLAGKLFLLR